MTVAVLRAVRDTFTSTSTTSVLSWDGRTGGLYMLEDVDRGLDFLMPLAEIRRRKIRGKTAIPVGRYRIRFTWSPKYQRIMPLVCDVPGFEGIRIHAGNTDEDTAGCLLPGTVRGPDRVGHSRNAARWLTDEIARIDGQPRGEVWLEIARDEAAWSAVLDPIGRRVVA